MQGGFACEVRNPQILPKIRDFSSLLKGRNGSLRFPQEDDDGQLIGDFLFAADGGRLHPRLDI